MTVSRLSDSTTGITAGRSVSLLMITAKGRRLGGIWHYLVRRRRPRLSISSSSFAQQDFITDEGRRRVGCKKWGIRVEGHHEFSFLNYHLGGGVTRDICFCMQNLTVLGFSGTISPYIGWRGLCASVAARFTVLKTFCLHS